MHKTGSGATTERCCFNGSDLLLLRPVWKSWAAASAAASSHWMNPVPWQRVTWSSGLWATACLPALLSVRLSIIHLSGSGTRGHPIQCKSVSCCKDATHRACHRAAEDRPGCLRQEAENQADTTTLLPSSQIDRYKSALFFAAACVNKTVSSWLTKIEHYTQIFKMKHLLTCCWKTGPWSDTVLTPQWNQY